MAGPIFVGYLVEKWDPAKLQDTKSVLAQLLGAQVDENSDPGRFEVTVHAHQGAAWVRVDDLVDQGEEDIGNGDYIITAQAISGATGSPTWLVEYKDAATFIALAQRVLPSGEITDDLIFGEDDDDGESPIAEQLRTRIWHHLCEHTSWPPTLLNVGPDASTGPFIVDKIKGELHDLKKELHALWGSDAAEGDADVDPTLANEAISLMPDLVLTADDVSVQLDAIISGLEDSGPAGKRAAEAHAEAALAENLPRLLGQFERCAESVAGENLAAINTQGTKKQVGLLRSFLGNTGRPKTAKEMCQRLELARGSLDAQQLQAFHEAASVVEVGNEMALALASAMKLSHLFLMVAEDALHYGRELYSSKP